MNSKPLLTASLLALSLGTGAVTMAAGGTGNDASRPPQTREHSPSMMGGMGMGGMGGGMMGSCPMMGGNMSMDPKTAMRMHGEMMKAMGDIMLKYSDQAGTSPSK
ncbi:hypothetical protein AWB81_05055 [Caballeronia arationis]|jgi:hypothetical protein|uniref:hypothetical protein n=1 Tax=Caballeronia arationis TaxID=1777142 RepID=UPI00074BA901|nr:hypothetical protein [Caballeronia arationis]SAK92887.1 hypothetical protein AWB81_05055 [Caballeronia arationis]